MNVSLTRRQLVWTAAGGAALFSARTMEAGDRGGVSFFLDGGNCLTWESVAGYRNVLDVFKYPVEVVSAVQAATFRTIIIPAGASLSLATTIALRRRAEAGDTLILESGLAFAEALEAESQCAAIREVFGLRVELASRPTTGRTSYLRYRWPTDVLVRHFGEPAAVSGTQCQPVAYLGGLTVAAKKPIGSGGVIFLGSPLGPMLMAQDREATLLVRQILRNC